MTKLLVIDTETGGVDPDRHSILSLAAVVWEDGRVTGELEVLVAETDITVTPKALEINGIDLVAHSRAAVAPQAALAGLMAFVDDQFADDIAAGRQVVLAGHNVGFDVGFLRRLCRLAGEAFPAVFSHRVLDTASVLRFLALAGHVPAAAVGSSEAFAHMGIRVPVKLRHTALGDARATAELIGQLLGLVPAPSAGELHVRAACELSLPPDNGRAVSMGGLPNGGGALSR